MTHLFAGAYVAAYSVGVAKVHFMLTWVLAAVALLVIMVGPTQGRVFCVGADGHVALEVAHPTGNCQTRTSAQDC